MGEKNHLVENADRLAGITTLTLVGLGIVQIILGETISKSVSLTANGIDCIGDSFVSGVVFLGLKVFRKPADQKFHYGRYKMENLASIGAAVVMIILAAYIILRSYYQLINPHPVKLPLLGAIVAFIAAFIAVGLGLFKYNKGKKSNMSSVRLEAFNTIKDGIASGLTVLALIFASMGFIIADAIAGFIIAGIIVSIGFAAIKESSLMLVDACDRFCIERGSAIKSMVKNIEGVQNAHIVRLRPSGPFYQGELEIEVSDELKIKEFNEIKKKITKKVQEEFPEIERLAITVSEK